jgi:hypothetical protein
MEASQIKIGSKRSLIWGSSTQYRPYKLNMVSKRFVFETQEAGRVSVAWVGV